MQTDKDLFNLIKETYPLQPRKEFVSSIEYKLRQSARKITRKNMMKRLTIVSSGLVLCMFAFSWFFLFSGKDIVLDTLTSLGEKETKTQDENIRTIEVVLQNSLTGPSDELNQILNDMSGEEKFEALSQYEQNLFKEYFADDMSYVEFVNNYGLTSMIASNGKDYYNFQVKNIEYEKTDSKEIIYNFTIELQYQKEGSENSEVVKVTGQANLNKEHKIEDMLIRMNDFLGSLHN
ncbi:MAG: hypothetical protein K6T88_09415 [Bacillus sp. (in: Bacteria)]|nr:hypothetical protein [Bacillus sp. (in: firmicutes)]